MIQDFFIAGTESVNVTLSWTLLFMAVHPDVQQNVRREIDDTIGRERPATMKDRLRLPYTVATLMECQRLGNIALFNVPRCTLEPVVVNGFEIPRGAWVFANRWGLHMSPRYWDRPQEFDPRRFLNASGDGVRQSEAWSPFGMGKSKVYSLFGMGKSKVYSLFGMGKSKVYSLFGMGKSKGYSLFGMGKSKVYSLFGTGKSKVYSPL